MKSGIGDLDSYVTAASDHHSLPLARAHAPASAEPLKYLKINKVIFKSIFQQNQAYKQKQN